MEKNKKINIEVILGELPGEVVTERSDNAIKDNLNKNIKSLGITVINHNKGVEVINIENENSNLLIGDVISEINRETISNTNSFANLVDELKETGRSSLLLKVIRDEEQLWLTIKFNN